MTSPHEGMPHGVPTSYDWAYGPRLSMGNNPKNFQAMIAWGHLYEDSKGNPATNSRVQIKHIKAYMLSKRDGKWHLLQSSKKVEGAAYREDYAGDVSKPANIRDEPDGSLSVKAGEGYNFHFWCANGRVSINPKDIAGILTTVQARLIIDNPRQRDDRSKARYLLSMGGDYWLDLTAQWDNFKTNADIGIGKFKYVTTRWQAFNMTTLSPTEIRQNPPPIVMNRSQSSD
ncbi:hypothetical protein IQ238_19055 [Pleurocapsales cyanobacterium LEGE 06147]|nr:hypothetical protein [Pleurocapsales cyanobacterium LEGE 06147]